MTKVLKTEWIKIELWEELCPYCNRVFSKYLPKARSLKAQHNNIEQNPKRKFFCCEEHKLQWIFEIQRRET